MAGNTFTLFFRIIARNREVYVLKILTLAIAIASSTLVIVFSLNEFGYDRFHTDSRGVFRMLTRNENEAHLGNRLSNKIPDETYARLGSLQTDSLVFSRVMIMNDLTVVTDQGTMNDLKIHSADHHIAKVFSFEVLDGSLREFSGEGRKAMLSASMAGRFFGTTEARGKIIGVCAFQDTVQFTVSTVFKDFPKNSHEDFDIFLLFDNVSTQPLGFDDSRSGVYGRASDHDFDALEHDINESAGLKDMLLQIQPLPDIYFGPSVSGEDSRHGDRYSILILVCISALILFLAISTYVNLTTLTLPYRSKELAMKKLAGASQLSLFLTFSRESLSLVVLSFFLSVLLLLFTASLTEPILGINMVSFLADGNLSFLYVMSGLLFVLALAPLFLTFKFIRASPTRLLSTETITFPRLKRLITVLQLGASIFLIVSSLVIQRQINYSLLKEPGRNHEQILFLNYPDDLTSEDLFRIRSGWQKYNPNVLDVIATSQLPDRISSKELNSPFYVVAADPYYPDFFGLNMLGGNWFKPNAGDSVMVLNERGMDDIYEGDARNVIGVIEDLSFLFNRPQKPLKFRLTPAFNFNYLCIKVLEVDIRRTIAYLSDFFDGASISILNKRFEEWLGYQDRLNTLSELLAIISVLLSCCAIYGLSVSLVRDKLKQIAVHKICGADTFHITVLLAREFVKEMVIAILFFGPVTYIFISELLRNFVYATHFQWMDPVFPLAYCVFIVLVLCAFQALGLSRRDLTSSLKG